MILSEVMPQFFHLYPGLHQKKHGQQVKGGDSTTPLCSGETAPGVLYPALEPSAQESTC